MIFAYGISQSSLDRWNDYQRIVAIQERRGAGVGDSLLRRLVDAELEAIEQATLAAARGDQPAAPRRVWSGFSRRR